MIKLIVVDLYGVISLGSYWDVCRWLGKKYKISPKKIYDVLYHKYFNAAAMGQMSQKEFFVGALKELEIDTDWRIVRDKHLAYQIPNKPAIKLCQSLQKQGYKILLLSKNIPSHFRHTKKTFGLKKHFKHIVNTFDLKLPKASRRTMRWVIKKFGMKPEEILMTDDQNFNLVEPRKLGVRTILYKNFSQFRRDLSRVLR